MEPFVYDALPGRIIFGNGSRRNVLEEVQRLGVDRILLIAGGHDLDRANEIVDYLGNYCVALFTDVAQHVPVQQANQARLLATEMGATATVTLGGGSATGFGKAISLSHGLPQICIPTTYAGSELTPIWGLTNGDTKETGRDIGVLPKVVIYDPELTLSLPICIAGPSAMNAFAHAVEGLYGPGANPVMTSVAFESIRVLSMHLPRMVDQPGDLVERSEVLYGAYLAGTVLAVVGTSLHHKICHVLGGLYGLDHGQMNAVVLPHALRFNAPAILPVYNRLCKVLGGDAATRIYDLASRLGTPHDLNSIGFPDDGPHIAAPLVAKAAQNNVRPISSEQAEELLQICAEGRRPE